MVYQNEVPAYRQAGNSLLLSRITMHKKILLIDNNGFTLISVLVTSLILAVGLLALVRIFSASPLINAVTDRISQSTSYAQDKIEEFRALGYDSLETMINAGDTTGIDTIGHIIRKYHLTFDTVDVDLIQMEVECSWQPLSIGGGKKVRFVTLMSRH
ncbi:MAG: prepilin-type N-terminal cleavage/methylation domain-containing protein [candidate division WOR-3 bacterium]|nr:prepilin-type N-terminal cleavage/methylation domain-containing protein [candidate division WOR-3 bacterium]